MLGGLLEAWERFERIGVLTSDHGNLEDLSTRRHTANPVPGLVIGDNALRRQFSSGLIDLTGIAPAILKMLNSNKKPERF